MAAPLRWRDRWRDRVLELRNGLLASPRFQRRATRLPLARGVARRRARDLFDLCAGFVYSQVLLACVQLRLFDALREGPLTAEAFAARSRLSPESALCLLKAATSLRLAEARSHGRFGLGVLGAALVGNPSLLAMVEHHAMLYADLADPVALLRGEAKDRALARYWPYAGDLPPGPLRPEQVDAYCELMAASQSLIAEQVLDAYPIGGHRCLLDVGGGDGAFLAAAAGRAPGLRLMLFDLPAVADRARDRLAGRGLSARATVTGGDFRSDPLPRGADVASLVRVVHDHDDAAALALLSAVREALPPGGVLLLAEPMSGTVGAEPIGDAYFAFYLLAMGSGRPRDPEALGELLRAAGFDEVRLLPTRIPLQTRLLVARRQS
ncbi:MAG: methyltransferase [Myxococcota bacterium]|nr:methyltransferase [Myxococcota bacterium]